MPLWTPAPLGTYFTRRRSTTAPTKRATQAPKLGAAMTAEQHINQAAAYAAIAYRNGDDILGDYWTERVTRLSDAAEAARCPTFDELKGSPDHSGALNA